MTHPFEAGRARIAVLFRKGFPCDTGQKNLGHERFNARFESLTVPLAGSDLGSTVRSATAGLPPKSNGQVAKGGQQLVSRNGPFIAAR